MTAPRLVALDTPIDPGLLARPVAGLHIPAGASLAAALASPDDRATLLVFLRHYG
ncbi:MAG: hypothetical protein AB8G26_16125 [Ilumatobacter sp.]